MLRKCALRIVPWRPATTPRSCPPTWPPPAGTIASSAPPWYARSPTPLRFAFLPMRIPGQSVGVMFAEQSTPGNRVWSLPEAAPLLSALRDSVVDALRRLKS